MDVRVAACWGACIRQLLACVVVGWYGLRSQRELPPVGWTFALQRVLAVLSRRYGAAIWSRYMPHRVLPICCSCCVYFVVLSCEYVPQPGARRAGVVYVFGSKPVPIA